MQAHPNISERHKNMLSILRYIIQTGEVSANDIMQATGLSFATISRVLASLLEAKFIVKCGKTCIELGRHPEIFASNSKYGYLVHFFIETDSVSAWIADFGKHVTAKAIKKIARDITLEELGKQFAELVSSLTERLALNKNQVLAASVAVPGVVDDKNHVIRRIPNLSGLNNKDLRRKIMEVLDIPVLISNEARFCALGEKICRFPYVDDITYVDITKYSGIGAGILLNGRIFSGKNGVAGELGDIIIDTGNLDYEYREQEGCLEMLAGLATLYHKCECLIREGKAPFLSSKLERKPLDFHMIERAALEDRAVEAVYDETVRMWSIAIINIISILNPELIILGGVFDDSNQKTLDRISHYVKRAIYHDVNIELTTLGEKAQLFGGLEMLASYTLEQIIAKKILEI